MKDPLRWLADSQAPTALREVLSSASPPPDMPAQLRHRLGRFTERLVAGSVAAGGAASAASAVRSAAAAVGNGGTATAGLATSAGSAMGGPASGLAPALGGNAVGLAAGTGAAGAPGTGLGVLLSWGASGVAAKTVVGVAVAGAVTAAYLGIGGTSTQGARNARSQGMESPATQPMASQLGRPRSVQATNRAAGLEDGTRALTTARQPAPASTVVRAASADSRRISAVREVASASPSASPPPDSGAVRVASKLPSEAAYGEPTLLDEARTLEQARAAVQNNPALALELVTDHQRYYLAGQLAAERELIAIEALLRLGRREEATRRAAPSLARAPGSLYARRLRRLLGSD